MNFFSTRLNLTGKRKENHDGEFKNLTVIQNNGQINSS